MTTDLVYVSEQTGEIVSPDNSAADLTIGRLTGFAMAKADLDGARSDLAARIEELVRNDDVARALRVEVRSLENEVAGVEEALAEVFSPAMRVQHGRGISLDLGVLRVTWPKPGERWTQRVKPEAIAQRDPALAKALGIERKVDKPRPPVITVRAPEPVQTLEEVMA